MILMHVYNSCCISLRDHFPMGLGLIEVKIVSRSALAPSLHWIAAIAEPKSMLWPLVSFRSSFTMRSTLELIKTCCARLAPVSGTKDVCA